MASGVGPKSKKCGMCLDPSLEGMEARLSEHE